MATVSDKPHFFDEVVACSPIHIYTDRDWLYVDYGNVAVIPYCVRECEVGIDLTYEQPDAGERVFTIYVENGTCFVGVDSRRVSQLCPMGLPRQVSAEILIACHVNPLFPTPGVLHIRQRSRNQ